MLWIIAAAAFTGMVAALVWAQERRERRAFKATLSEIERAQPGGFR
jgi:hypothetical protein